MKVEQTSRGGKKGAPRGRGRGQRKAFEKADLVVTVPNDESGASRLKPPVNTTQPRKIVRLNQNKTGELIPMVFIICLLKEGAKRLIC